MTLIQVLLGEHGAIYPLLEQIETTAPTADLPGLKMQANLLCATLLSHADLEDDLLRPDVLPFLPAAAPAADGGVAPTDHEIIRAGLAQVSAASEVTEARRWLMETVAKTRKHFFKEETIVFGIARRKLSPERQNELAGEWARRRGVSLN